MCAQNSPSVKLQSKDILVTDMLAHITDFELKLRLWEALLANRAQYGIDLPGSLHTNKIPVILGRYPLLGFFCRLNIVPLDRDNGTFNSSNTDVVEKVNFLVAASKHGGTSVAEGSP